MSDKRQKMWDHIIIPWDDASPSGFEKLKGTMTFLDSFDEGYILILSRVLHFVLKTDGYYLVPVVVAC